MSNIPSAEEWAIADVVSRPEELFVLWALGQGIFESRERIFHSNLMK